MVSGARLYDLQPLAHPWVPTFVGMTMGVATMTAPIDSGQRMPTRHRPPQATAAFGSTAAS